jgi:tRNA(fMet)-specific endonuclease VapC
VTLWLLDTNALSDMVRTGRGPISQGIERVGRDNVCTSIIVACELRFGAEKRGATKLTERIEDILQAFDIQPLSEDADRHYARLRNQLESQGTPIGRNDMLIAAHALALDATLVTANTREFARIEGLKLENWLE